MNGSGPATLPPFLPLSLLQRGGSLLCGQAERRASRLARGPSDDARTATLHGGMTIACPPGHENLLGAPVRNPHADSRAHLSPSPREYR